jgi:hypothetical protein
MGSILYQEGNVWLFIFVTLVLGGGAAWMTGRAVALGWDPLPKLIFYLLLLALAVRFVHHALFGGSMFSLHYYVVDAIILLVIGLVGFRYTRTSQMVTQYRWLYERSGLFAWRERERVNSSD